jgi:hypothetical protein
MSDEIRTAVDLRASIVEQRGGIERFDGPQRRLLDALVFELAKKPNEIDVRVVTDLMAMLPRPVSVPERDNHPDPRLVMWEIYKTMRERGEIDLKPDEGWYQARIAKLEAEIIALGGHPSASEPGVRHRGEAENCISGHLCGPIDPADADITPPGERAECDPGVKPGPDDWRARRSTTVIEGKANPPAAGAPAKPPRPAWEDWLAAGGYSGPGYDRWSNWNGA